MLSEMKALTLHHSGIPYGPIAAPAVRISVFVPGDARVIAKDAGVAVGEYLALIPPDAICARLVGDEESDSGGEGSVWLEPFTARDMALLVQEYATAFDVAGTESHTVFLFPRQDFLATGFSLRTILDTNTTSFSPNWTNFIFFEVALNFAKEQPEELVGFARALASRFPGASVTCSTGFSYSLGVEPMLRDQINAKLLRFVGMDPCYDHLHYRLGSSVPFVAWLVYCNGSQMDQLGGVDMLRDRLGDQVVEPLAIGAMLRAANMPPLGDVNRGAPDIGVMPRLRRVLAPVLFDKASELRRFPEEMAERWLARFDSRPDQPWQNAELIPY